MVETTGTSPALLLGALILVIASAVAILVAMLVYIARARSKARAERAALHPVAPHPSAVEPIALSPIHEDAGEPAELPLEAPGRPGEVMRVIRDKQTGRILVEVEGRSYAHIREIGDAQVGRRVLWAIADLIRFTGGMAANAQAVHSAAQRAAQEQGLPIPIDAAHAEAGQAAAPDRAAARLEAPEPRPPSPSPSTAPSGSLQPERSLGERYSISAFFRRGFRPPPSTPEPSPTWFVAEIEVILQDLIEQRATPLPHEVHLSVGAGGRLQVEVGHEVYDSADEVPDPEVQALIRAAVAEWEKR